ncbi:MAG: MucR family transcriptional regulator [Caulobacterales bacterium]|nr:MucR family transcriptional regulator [Caulobacterales bacterium]
MDEKGVEPAISNEDVLKMTTSIVSSFVSNNTIPADTVPEVIRQVHKTVHHLANTPSEKQLEKPKPAVPISKSVTEDYIVCLEDGKKLKMLKRYLRSNYNMTPDEYRRKWGLPSDYPMVAPSYAAKRSEFAKKIGLGKGVRRKGG